MVQSATLLDLSQLVDAALMSPEVGVVNFNLLHILLRVMIQQLGIDQIKLEFTGETSETIQKLYDPTKTIELDATIYTAQADKKVETKPALNVKKSETKPVPVAPVPQPSNQNIPPAAPPPVPEAAPPKKVQKTKSQEIKPAASKNKVASNLQVDKADKQVDKADKAPEKPKAINPSPNIDAAPKDPVVIVPRSSIINGQKHIPSTFTVAVTTDKWNEVLADLATLKQQYTDLVQMSSNRDLIDAVRSVHTQGSVQPSPMVDMFQILTLNKRIDAAEIGMQKLASMIEDLAKQTSAERQLGVVGMSGIEGPAGAHEMSFHQSAGSAGVFPGLPNQTGFGSLPIGSEKDGGASVPSYARSGSFAAHGHTDGVAGAVSNLDKRVTLLETKADEGTRLPKLNEPAGPVIGGDFAMIDLSKKPVPEAIKILQNEISNIRNLIQTMNVPELQAKVESGFGAAATSGGINYKHITISPFTLSNQVAI